MSTRFYDYTTGLYFKFDYIKLRNLLIRLERESKNGKIITYDDYLKRIGFNDNWVSEYSSTPIGREVQDYWFEFELMPIKIDKCICIIIHR